MPTPEELSQSIIKNIQDWDDLDLALYDSAGDARQKIKSAIDCLEFTAESLRLVSSQLEEAEKAHVQSGQPIYDNLTSIASDVAELETGGPVDPPPPTPSQTIYGYTAYRQNLSNAKSNGIKDPGIWRVFTGSRSLDLSKSDYQKAPVTWSSWKANQLRPETWGTQVLDHARAVIPKDRKVLITAHHEPENNQGSGQSLDQWSKAWRQGITEITRACKQLRQEGWDIWSAPVVCDWVFERWNNQSEERWYPTDGGIEIDIMGWDSYPQGQNSKGRKNIARLHMISDFKPSPYADSTRFDCYKSFRRTADHAAKLGVPWGIAEIGLVRGDFDGADVQYNYSLENRADWVRDVTNDINNVLGPKAPAYVAWYLDGGCNITDSKGVAAINESL